MRFLPILLCAALIAASCNSSLSGAKAPSGQMPAIRYGVLEDYAAGMETSDVESLESYDDVLIEYALFDYRQKLLENPGAEFYDCAAADFDPAGNRLYYYYRLVRPDSPESPESLTLLTFIGCLNVETGERVPITVLEDSAGRGLEAIGGENYGAGVATVETEVGEIPVDGTYGDEAAPPGNTRENFSIIETPDSSRFTLDILTLPELILRLSDGGELLVLSGSEFWVYGYDESRAVSVGSASENLKLAAPSEPAPVSGPAEPGFAGEPYGYVELLHDSLDAFADNAAIESCAMLAQFGWSMGITDAVPVLVTPELTEIFFNYTLTPPSIRGADTGEPEKPLIGFATPAIELDGDGAGEGTVTEEELLQNEYGDNRPFCFPLRYRSEAVEAEAGEDEEATAGNTETAEAVETSITPLVNDGAFGEHHNTSTGRDKGVYDGGYNLREVYFTPAGNEEYPGLLIITTPRAAMVYNAWSGEYEAFSTGFTIRNLVEYIVANGLDPKAYLEHYHNDFSPVGPLIHFNFRSAVAFSYSKDAGGFEKAFLLRSNSDASATLTVGGTKTEDGGVRLTSVIFDPDKEISWDYNARLLSMREVAAYNDPDFMTEPKTLFPRIAREYYLPGESYIPPPAAGEAFVFAVPNPPVWRTGFTETVEFFFNASYFDARSLDGMFAMSVWAGAMTYSRVADRINYLKLVFTQDKVFQSTYIYSDYNPVQYGVFTRITLPGDAGFGFAGARGEETEAYLGCDLKFAALPAALHASLEEGLSICYMAHSGFENITVLQGDGSFKLDPPIHGHYLIEGYRLDGAYYAAYPTTNPAADCVLVGFRDPSRAPMITDLKDASVMLVKLSADEAAEQSWIEAE